MTGDLVEHIPVWLQAIFAIAGLSQPLIIWLLTVAHGDRKELLSGIAKINGRIGVLEDWRNRAERDLAALDANLDRVWQRSKES